MAYLHDLVHLILSMRVNAVCAVCFIIARRQPSLFTHPALYISFSLLLKRKIVLLDYDMINHEIITFC